jgi:hypothetical protein
MALTPRQMIQYCEWRDFAFMRNRLRSDAGPVMRCFLATWSADHAHQIQMIAGMWDESHIHATWYDWYLGESHAEDPTDVRAADRLHDAEHS